MKEAVAWKRLAEWFGADQNREFICNVLRHPFIHRVEFLDTKMAETMFGRIYAHQASSDFSEGSTLDVTDERNGTLWHNKKSSDARVMFCLFMAMECQEETTP